MIANITTCITGIISAIGDLISFGTLSGDGQAAAGWTVILALALSGGVAAFGVRLVKKFRN